MLVTVGYPVNGSFIMVNSTYPQERIDAIINHIENQNNLNICFWVKRNNINANNSVTISYIVHVLKMLSNVKNLIVIVNDKSSPLHDKRFTRDDIDLLEIIAVSTKLVKEQLAQDSKKLRKLTKTNLNIIKKNEAKRFWSSLQNNRLNTYNSFRDKAYDLIPEQYIQKLHSIHQKHIKGIDNYINILALRIGTNSDYNKALINLLNVIDSKFKKSSIITA